MATQKKKKKKRPPGGAAGAPPRSEPRVQLFSKFAGCDFRMATHAFDTSFQEHTDEPTDLMQNYMVIQNNAEITGVGTIQTRQNLVELFAAPTGTLMTGVATFFGDRLFAALNDNTVRYGPIPAEGVGSLSNIVTKDDIDAVEHNDRWTFLGYADNKLVGMTEGLQLWTGTTGDPTGRLQNAKTIPDPTTALAIGVLTGVGLTIGTSYTTTNKYRITLSYTLLNKFGPTKLSPALTFFASKPTLEWSASAYVRIDTTESVAAYANYGIVAVELYFTEGEYQEPAFLGRVNATSDVGWVFNWVGTQVNTATWMIANLVAPDQNYTGGVPASKMAALDGALYFWGNTTYPYRIWIGGNPGNRFSVSAGTGGGFVDCEPGTGSKVTNVMKFKTQQGAAIVTALCDNVNSQKEARFNLVESTISLSDEQSIKGWMAEKVAGAAGCKSSRGALVAGDGLYAVSRYGLALTTLTMEYNSQLRIQYVSDAISPVFLQQFGSGLTTSSLFAVNDVLYLALGNADGTIDNVIFCYDIDAMAWWTYTLDVDSAILNMIPIDYEGRREGIGIITANKVYLLPTTRDESHDTPPLHEILLESGELTTMQPLQAMHHLSQLEFRFDYFIGEMDIIVEMVDQFGRRIDTRKHVSHTTMQHQLSEYVRVDAVVESYKVTLKGAARMRLTHFLAKVYPKSNRIGMVYGFDSRQSHTSHGSIHRTFANYNDIKEAIIP